jgi:hypothetical protein
MGVDAQGVATRIGQGIEELIADVDAVRGVEVLANCRRLRSRFRIRAAGEPDNENTDDDDGSNVSVISERVTLEQTATKLQNLGYSVADILAFYVGTTIRSETPDKYNMEFFIKMNEDLDGILDGSIPLSQRDTRSYAAVAGSLS